MDLSVLNIFDVASYVMEFIKKGLLVLEHEGQAVLPTAINPVNGRIVLSTSKSQPVVTGVSAPVVTTPTESGSDTNAPSATSAG
jgi:hypothetical protein